MHNEAGSGMEPVFFRNVEKSKMFLRDYMDAISRATKSLAKGIFIAGLLLVGFGALILAMPEVFAALVAAILVIAGLGCIITAGKIFWQNRRLHSKSSDDSQGYRENVQIHIEEHYDM